MISVNGFCKSPLILLSVFLFSFSPIFANELDDEEFETAISLYKLDLDRSALHMFLKLAEKGHAKAQYQIGYMYFQGKGVDNKDIKEAAKWYKKSAENGYLLAQLILGAMYQQGSGVPQDYQESMKWYMKAAEKGIPDAQHNVAVMYQEGMGVERNYDEAFKWYLKAAGQGLAISQFNLALMYANGLGTLQDSIIAYAWICIASQGGVEHAIVLREQIEGNLFKDPLEYRLGREKAQELIEKYHLKITLK